MRYAIGVDLGGGSTKCAVVNENGKIVWPSNGNPISISYKNDAKNPISTDIPAKALKALLQKVSNEYGSLDTVGIAATGLVSETGIVNEGVSFNNYQNYDWSNIAKGLGFRKVKVTHDVRAAAWAEYIAQGKPKGKMLHVTLGTGIGGALLLDGDFFYGLNYAQGEIGYMPFLNETKTGNSFAQQANEGSVLGVMLTSLIHLINPKYIYLDGFANRSIKSAEDFINKHAFAISLKGLEIKGVNEQSNDIRKLAWDAATKQNRQTNETLIYLARRNNSIGSAIVTNTSVADFGERIGKVYMWPSEQIFLHEDFVFLEKYSGAFGVEAIYEYLTRNKKEFRDIANSTRKEAEKSLFSAGMLLGYSLVNATYITEADIITLGGKLPTVAPSYIAAVNQTFSKYYDGSNPPDIRIGRAENEAGIIGAALYALGVGLA